MPAAALARPLAFAGLVGLCAAAAAAAPGAGPLPVQESACWRCHSAWTPPLRVPTTLASLGGAAAPGEVLQPNLVLQNAWLAEARHATVAIDLAQAPSLAFSAAVPPLRQVTPLVLRPDPAQPTAAAVREATVNLTSSPSASHVRVVPASADPALGPRLAASLAYPDGRVVRAVAAGRGQAIEVPEALTGQVGTVRVAVELPGLEPGDAAAYSLPVAEVAATVEAVASFEYAGLRQATLALPAPLAAGGSAPLAGMNFSVLREPGPGERVGFTVNTTVHYAHRSPAEDWANWTQETVWVPLVASGGRTGLASSAVAPPAPPVNGPTLTTVGEAVGYMGAFLIVASVASGGLFGKASRRAMNNLFGSAKRRVAFHNVLSYGLILASLAHLVLFLAEGRHPWAKGFLWGGGAMLAMLGLGVTGALQVLVIRRWGFGAWRAAHYGMALAVVALTLAHLLLEGEHFGPLQKAVGYTDPLAPAA